MRTSLFVLPLLLILMLALPARADEPPTITTWGKATLYVTPDRAVISVAVSSADEEPAKAIAENRANAEKLLAALKGQGIDEKNIQSGYVSTGIGYWFNRWPSTATLDDKRFHITRSYAITVTDLKLIDKVIDTALKNGANQIDGVDLQVADLAKVRDQARQQAVRNAKAKADILAKELDASVGKPKTITETNADSYSASGGINGGGAFIAGPEEREPDPVYLPGKVSVEAAVRVTFELK